MTTKAAYPGVEWPDIGRYLWITAAVYGGVAAAALVWDSLAVTVARESRPRQLHSYQKRVREPLRNRVIRRFHPTRLRVGRLIELVNFWLSCAMLLEYVVSTYEPVVVTAGFTITTFIFNGYFIVRYLLYGALTEPGQRLLYVVGFVQSCDLISIVGAILPVTHGTNTWMTLTYLRAVVIYSSYTALDVWLAPALLCTRLQLAITRVVVAGLAFLVIFGCTVATLERAGELGDLSVLSGGSSQQFTLWNAVGG
jgi:hypothetical protein